MIKNILDLASMRTMPACLRRTMSGILGPDTRCVACGRPMTSARNTGIDHMPSPLAGYVVMPTCSGCREHRAVYPVQAAWFLSHVCHILYGGTPDQRTWDWMEDAISLDGWKEGDLTGSPVHVFESGDYVTLRDWIGSPQHVVADGAWRSAVRKAASDRLTREEGND